MERAELGATCGIACSARSIASTRASTVRREGIVHLGEQQGELARPEHLLERARGDEVGVAGDDQAVERVVLPDAHREVHARREQQRVERDEEPARAKDAGEDPLEPAGAGCVHRLGFSRRSPVPIRR